MPTGSAKYKFGYLNTFQLNIFFYGMIEDLEKKIGLYALLMTGTS